MRPKVGDGVYDFNTWHFGVHPQAAVSTQQCPGVLDSPAIQAVMDEYPGRPGVEPAPR